MTVQELIDALRKIDDKQQLVRLFTYHRDTDNRLLKAVFAFERDYGGECCCKLLFEAT